MTYIQLGLAYLLAAGVMLAAGTSRAHPLGNNTINRAAAIHVERDRIVVHYRLDLAEIPTLLASQDADGNGDGDVSAAEWDAHASDQSARALAGLGLAADGIALELRGTDSAWRLRPGAAGLKTLLLDFTYSVPWTASPATRLEYRDDRRRDEPGWKEVTANAAAGIALVGSDVPTGSPSGFLLAYPSAGTAPPSVLEARMGIGVAGTAVSAPHVPLQYGHADPNAAHHVPTPEVRPSQGRTTTPSAEHLPGSRPAPSVAAPKKSEARPRVADFFHLGVYHIATGWDHLTFLLGLVAAHRSRKGLVWMISAFTLAHSLTLGLAAGRVIPAPGEWVEPAIALTIAYVGLANLTKTFTHGALLAFAFGLVHGLGFAGALEESLTGTQAGGRHWLVNLAAFNLGIEVFQLALILALVPLLALASRYGPGEHLRRLASVGVLAAGMGWFLARI